MDRYSLNFWFNGTTENDGTWLNRFGLKHIPMVVRWYSKFTSAIVNTGTEIVDGCIGIYFDDASITVPLDKVHCRIMTFDKTVKQGTKVKVIAYGKFNHPVVNLHFEKVS